MRTPQTTLRRLAVAAPLLLVAALTTACELTAGISDGTLLVFGSAGPDTIVLRSSATIPGHVAVDFGNDGTEEHTFDLADLTAIVVAAGEGDDTITNLTTFSDKAFTFQGAGGDDTINGRFAGETIDGGPGNDTLRGSLGSDTIVGGDGNDTIVGGDGNDTISGGEGNDTVAWAPGDDDDTVDGNGGTDTVEVSGANANEIITFSAAGDRAILHRDIANVTISTDTVERVDLDLRGGADVVHAPDLVGTSLATVNIDPSSDGGVDDGQSDVVAVSPTASFSSDATAAIATATTTSYRVTNGFPTDRFTTTGTGTETISVTGTAGPDIVSATQSAGTVVVSGATKALPVHVSSVADVDLDLGAGTDQFQHIGSDADEALLVTAAGSRVGILHPATEARTSSGTASPIDVNLDAVESADFRLAAGADRITVNDLSGTDLGLLTVSLGQLLTAAPDGSPDTIVLIGTPNPDQVGVDAFGSGLVVLGLAPTIGISGQDTTLDTLRIATLGGSDTVTVTGAASTLIKTQVL